LKKSQALRSQQKNLTLVFGLLIFFIRFELMHILSQSKLEVKRFLFLYQCTIPAGDGSRFYAKVSGAAGWPTC
jgi:hypothetical protein